MEELNESTKCSLWELCRDFLKVNVEVSFLMHLPQGMCRITTHTDTRAHAHTHTHTHMHTLNQCQVTHCRSHSVQEVTNFISAGSDCCGDDYMRWYPFHEVVESEEKETIEIGSFHTYECWSRQPHPQLSAAVLITRQVESCSIVKNQLVGDEHRVGKVAVGRVKGFIELIPDVDATDIGANTGTLKLSIAVCTE